MPSQQAEVPSTNLSDTALVTTIVQLARDASIEINVQDIPQLQASRAFLAARQENLCESSAEADLAQTRQRHAAQCAKRASTRCLICRRA